MRRKSLFGAVLVIALLGLTRIGSLDAAVDKTFNGTGRYTEDFTAKFQIAARPNGNVVSVGVRESGPIPASNVAGNRTELQITELTPAGAVALVTIRDVPTANAATAPLYRVRGVDLDAAGKIYVQTAMTTDPATSAIVARFNSNGTPDTTFSGDGFNGYNGCGELVGGALAPDGKLYSLFFSSEAACSGTTIRRWNANGTPDATFGTNGVLAKNDVFPTAMTLDKDGNIVVVGGTGAATMGVFKADANGKTIAWTTTFNPVGVAFNDFGPDEEFFVGQANVTGYHNKLLTGVDTDSTGRIVAVGATNVTNGGGVDLFAARLTSGGALDPSFSGDGKAFHNVTGGDDYAFRVAIDASDRPVVAGTMNKPPSKLFVTRLTVGGGVDTTDLGGVGALPDESMYPGSIAIAGSRIYTAGARTRPTLSGGWVTSHTFGGAPPPPSGGGGVPVSGDFNGDGRGDIFWYNAGTATDYLWLGKADGTFENAPAPNVLNALQPVVGDFNNDDKDDIFWYAPGVAVDYLWLGYNGSAFVGGTAPNVINSLRPVVGDFNNDGKDDVFWHAPGTAVDYHWTGYSGSSFSAGAAPNVIASLYPISGDFNNDEKDDIFWYAPGGAKDYLWTGFNGSVFSSAAAPNVIGTFLPVSGDFNKDGKDDVFWHAPGGATDYLWTGYTGSGFSSGTAPNVTAGSLIPVVVDVEGDGFDNIFWYAPGPSTDFMWLKYTGSGFQSGTAPNV